MPQRVSHSCRDSIAKRFVIFDLPIEDGPQVTVYGSNRTPRAARHLQAKHRVPYKELRAIIPDASWGYIVQGKKAKITAREKKKPPTSRDLHSFRHFSSMAG